MLVLTFLILKSMLSDISVITKVFLRDKFAWTNLNLRLEQQDFPTLSICLLSLYICFLQVVECWIKFSNQFFHSMSVSLNWLFSPLALTEIIMDCVLHFCRSLVCLWICLVLKHHINLIFWSLFWAYKVPKLLFTCGFVFHPFKSEKESGWVNCSWSGIIICMHNPPPQP